MEAAMGEHQTDAEPMDAIRTHLQAIRTESARRDPQARGVAGLQARERLVHRLEPLPERLAALNARVSAKLEELGGTLRPPRRPQSADDSNCQVLADIACAAYQLSDEAKEEADVIFWYEFAEAIVDQYADCIDAF
jgi:hypothetical protein